MSSYNVGDRIGDYEIIGTLGEGGMGKVFKVKNVISDRIEAMKVLHPQLGEHPEAMTRFLREIRLQAGLEHPHIAALRTAVTHGQQLLMIMEFVEGETLSGLMKSRGGKVPPAEAAQYIAQVLEALGYAHSRNIVHRDVKPANIILAPGGQAKLMDFGVAKLVEDHQLTATGATLGSLFYMSPEQIRGEQIDGRSDLYSVGITLYELVTGKRPFDAETQFSIMRAHLEQQPLPPLQVDPSLPAQLNEIILMSLKKDAGERFQTADAFRNALTSLYPQVAAKVSTAAASAPTAPMNSVAPQAKQPAAAGGRRAVYLVLGSLITILVLAIVALQAPKWFGTAAGTANQAQTPAVQTPGAEPSPVPAAEPAAASSQPAQDATQVPVQSASVPASGAAQSPAVRPAEPRQRPATGSNAGSQSVTAQPPQQAPATSTAAAQSPAPAAPVRNEAERNRVAEMKDDLSIRANTVLKGLESIEREQRAQGLSLRSDMVSARMRMESQMDAAERAFGAGRFEDAEAALKNAEQSIRRLERFLGQ